ncbi:MAG: glycosyltransferase, partial [Acidobacteriota bacterium]
NDGSRDRTYDIMKELREKHGTVRVVDFDGRFGQHAALLAGIIMSRGELVCPIDADLQNDPGDVIPMLEKLEEGYDVVKGVRVKRMAPWLRKRYSFIANKVLRLLVNHDRSSTLWGRDSRLTLRIPNVSAMSARTVL